MGCRALKMSPEEYRSAAVEAVRRLGQDVGIPQRISEVGVKGEDIDFLADSALADACTPGNPKDPTISGHRGAIPVYALMADRLFYLHVSVI